MTILRDLRRPGTRHAPAVLLGEAIERLRVRAMLMTRSTDQASRSLANVDALVEKADPHWLAEDRVPIEPVWAAKSLLSGKIRGISDAI